MKGAGRHAPERYAVRPARRLAGLLALAWLATGAGLAQDGRSRRVPQPAAEARGLWVVRTDLTSPASVRRVVETARRNGFNTLFVQCRGRGDAYYLGGREPRAQALATAPAEFDPLAMAVAEGHAAGMRIHAWVNSCYVWSDRNPPASPEHLVNAHPEWLAVDRSGRRCAPGDPEVFICPGSPEARHHLVEVCRDLARRYAIDGLQLDYIRYANRNLCFCSGCLRRFESYLRERLPNLPAARSEAERRAWTARYAALWEQFRRDQVTTLVREVRRAVKAERPDLVLSGALITWGAFPGDFRRSAAYRIVGQDWYGWLRAGLLDLACPMTYQTKDSAFAAWVHGVRRDLPRARVWFGIAAYLVGPESAAQKVRLVRQAGAQGWVLFSYTAVTRNGSSDRYLRLFRDRVLPDEAAANR